MAIPESLRVQYPPYMILHAEFGEPHCPGLLYAVPRESGELVDFECNDCGAIVRTVAASESASTIEAMREDNGDGVSAFCNHCGGINEFPGYSEMFAFICRHCGQSVTLARA
jgi:hypothetical protein